MLLVPGVGLWMGIYHWWGTVDSLWEDEMRKSPALITLSARVIDGVRVRLDWTATPSNILNGISGATAFMHQL